MYFSWHLAIGLILSVPLTIFVSPIFALFFLLASVGIDFDHYLYYTFILRKTNPKKMLDEWQTLIKNKSDPFILIFHNIEFFIALILASFFLSGFAFFLYPVTFGVLVHFVSDGLWDLTRDEHLKKRYWSVVLWVIFKLKKSGGPAGV